MLNKSNSIILYNIFYYAVYMFVVLTILPTTLGNIGYSNIEIGYMYSIMNSCNLLIVVLLIYFSFNTRNYIYTNLLALLSTFFLVYLVYNNIYTRYMYLAIFLFAFFNLFNGSYLDSMTLNTFKEKYGYARSFGSYGFFFTGLILFFFTIDEKYYYIGLLISTFILFILSFKLSNDKDLHQDINITWKHVINEYWIWIFLFIFQLGMGIHYTYYSIYLINHDYQLNQIFLIWSIPVLFESLSFMFQKQIFNIFSIKSLILISIIMTIIRFILLEYFIDNFYLQIIINILHVFGFALIHSSLLNYFSTKYENYYEYLKIYRAILFGIALIVGAMLGGYLYSTTNLLYIVAFIISISLIPFFKIKLN